MNRKQAVEAELGNRVETFCIKDNLAKSIRLTPRDGEVELAAQHVAFKNSIEEHVFFARDVSFFAAQLVNFHILRAMRADGFPLPIINGNFYYKAMQAVSGNDCREPNLQATWHAFRALLPHDWQQPDMDLKSSLVSELAKDMGKNFENHLVTNFERVLKRHILFELPDQWTVEVRTKVAHHVFRRVSGLDTYWPPTVDETQERQDAANDAVALMIAREYHLHRGPDEPLFESAIRTRVRADPTPVLSMFADLIGRLEVPEVHRDPPQQFIGRSYIDRKLRKLDAYGLMSPSAKKTLGRHVIRLSYLARDEQLEPPPVTQADEISVTIFFWGIVRNGGGIFDIILAANRHRASIGRL